LFDGFTENDQELTNEEDMQLFDAIIVRKDSFRKKQEVTTFQTPDGQYGKNGSEIIQDGGSSSVETNDDPQSLWDRLNKVPDLERPDTNKNNPDYDGPVEPGKEVELYKGEVDKVADPNKDETSQEIDLVAPEIPLPQELAEKLSFSRDEFVKLSAKRRGIQSIGYKRKLKAAKEAYETARDNAGSYVAERMQEMGLSPERVRELGVAGAVAELQVTTCAVAELQTSKDGPFKGFLEKWASWGGRREDGKRNVAGFLKKSGVMFVAGTVVAAPIGLLGGAILGTGAGAVAGILVAQRVARGLMGAKLNGAAEGYKVAEAQAAVQYNADVTRLAGTERVLNTADITEGIQDLTDRSVRRNRRRAIGAAAIAAAAGAGTIAGAHFLGDVFGGTPNGKITMIDKKPGLPKGPTLPKGPLTEAGGGNPGVIELNPTDSRLPWTHVNDLLSKFGDKVGGKNSTPAIFDLVERGKQYGINITGKGRGLESVTLNGQTFTDNGHINAALDEIMRRTLVDAAEAQS
jgi:hypothetical protein